MKEYKGVFDNYPDIKVGDKIKIIGKDAGVFDHYPPVGTILVIERWPSGMKVLNCTEYELGYRTGSGLTYTLVGDFSHLKGIAKFLKEKGL